MMILRNRVLWNNEMNLAIGLRTELDNEEFLEVVEETHLELTGEKIDIKEWEIDETDIFLKLELV